MHTTHQIGFSRAVRSIQGHRNEPNTLVRAVMTLEVIPQVVNEVDASRGAHQIAMQSLVDVLVVEE